MPATANIAHRLTCLALGMLFMFPRIDQAAAEPSVSTPAEAQSGERKLDILPTLKGHMARLGTLMNTLFRDVDDESRKERVLITLAEMRFLLTKVSKKFVPAKIVDLSDSVSKTNAIAGFKACTEQAVGFLEKITSELNRNKFTEARNSLYSLDSLRRNCHSKYAGE